MNILNFGANKNKVFYFGINESGNVNVRSLEQKWSFKSNDDLSFELLTLALKSAKYFAPILYQYFNQYKLLHRRIKSNKLVHEMNISEDDKCLFCIQRIDTLEHIYVDCENARNIWMKQIAG